MVFHFLSQTIIYKYGLFVDTSNQTGLDTRSKARGPIKVGYREGKVGNELKLELC